MSITTAPTTSVPTGTWQLDATHSTAGFAIKHMVVATFRSRFKHVDATLEAGSDGTARLVGTVQASSIDIDDPDFKGHLGSPEFFDVASHPEITFTSTDLRVDGSELVAAGDLTIKGRTHRVEGRGSIAEPTEDFMGATRLGVSLSTSIDRTAYGLEWNAPLPKGGWALANEVVLTLELEFVKAEA